MSKRLLPFLLSFAIAGCGVASPALQSAPAARTAIAAKASQAAPSMEAFFQDVFRIADADHDGKLSQAETGLLREQFQVLDRDGDGAITAADWQAKASFGEILKKLPVFLPMVLALRGQLDANHDQLVTMGEVNGALSAGGRDRAPALLGAERISGAFQAADLDRSGALNGDEFQQFYLEAATPAGAALTSGGASEVGPSRGLARNVVMSLLGTYVSLMAHIATPRAIHPARLPIRQTPDQAGMAYENVAFKTEDGLTLKGWYVPAKKAGAKTLILVHGISDNRDYFMRLGILPMVHDDYNVLAFDLRNQGESEGSATSFGYHEGKDVVAAVNFLKARGDREIAIMGVSLGGASAIRGAALCPDIKAVIDDCAYSTVANAFKGFISLTFIPCPVLIAVATVAEANRTLGVDMESTEPITQIGKVAPRPLLVIHGEKDPNVSVDNSRSNYFAAGENLHKELWVVPNGGHAESAKAQPAEYKKRVLAFLAQNF